MPKFKASVFPIARIKKVMQSDEEIGKVAQAAPVLVSKALELFLKKILEQAAEIVREQEGKKVTPDHIFSCVDSDELFDFLKETVKST